MLRPTSLSTAESHNARRPMIASVTGTPRSTADIAYPPLPWWFMQGLTLDGRVIHGLVVVALRLLQGSDFEQRCRLRHLLGGLGLLGCAAAAGSIAKDATTAATTVENTRLLVFIVSLPKLCRQMGAEEALCAGSRPTPHGNLPTGRVAECETSHLGTVPA